MATFTPPALRPASSALRVRSTHSTRSTRSTQWGSAVPRLHQRRCARNHSGTACMQASPRTLGPMWRLLPARCRTAPPMTKLLLFLTYLVAAAAVRSRGPGWRDGGPTPSPDAVPVTQSSKADTRAHVAGMTMHVAASSWDSQVQQLPAARRSLLHAAGCHRPRCDLNRFGSHMHGRHVRPTDAAHAQRSWQDLCRPIVRPALIPLAPVTSK